MDVDIIVSNRYHECDKLIQSLENGKIDTKILRDDEHWEEKGMILNWMKKSFSYDWVKQSGHHEINDFFMDSQCFFYLHQIKFISLAIQIERLKKRNSINSYVDLLAIHYNNAPIKGQCIHPLQFRQGKIEIIDSSMYHCMIRTIKERLYDWQSITLSIQKIESIFPFCNITAHHNLNHFYQYLETIISLYKQTYPSSHTCLFNCDKIPNAKFIIIHTINIPFLTKNINIKNFSINKHNSHIKINDIHTVPTQIHIPGYTLYERTKILEHYDGSLDLDELNLARLFITYVFKKS
jgi:hypothetical protein